jgi:hypothetical protein
VVAGIADNNRAPNHYRKPAESSEPVEKHRLTQEQVDVVANEFHASIIARNPRASPFTSASRIEMFLSYLAPGGYYRQMAKSQGVATSTALLYTHEVVTFLYERSSQHISLPGPEEFDDEPSLPLQDPDGQSLNVILHIDGVR